MTIHRREDVNWPVGKEGHRAVRAHSTGVLSDSWGKESNVSVGEESVLSMCKGPVAGLGGTYRDELRQRGDWRGLQDLHTAQKTC